jgi:HEAT repeat protein
VLDLEACVLRICDDTGQTWGTGFLVTETLAVTCAHVVKACGAGPGGRVRVVFHRGGAARQAEVRRDGWREVDGDDVAILSLQLEGAPLPEGVRPARLGSTRACGGHRMRALGFPPLNGGYDVAWAEGELRGVVPHPRKRPMLQMDAWPIREGMSGAPVLDLETGRVVGMVNEYLEGAPLEWATTSETLHQACPAIPLYPPQAVEDYLEDVRRYCAELPYLTLHDIRPPRTLDEVYVPLQARPQMRPDRRATASSCPPEGPLSISDVMRRRDPPHILILGEPGAGKSTLLRQLAQRAWDRPHEVGLDALHLPLLIPLRRLAAQEAGSLEERLRRAVTGELVPKRDLPEDFFTRWPQQTDANWLLLLDGLDEVPAERRPRLTAWLRETFPALGPVRIVVTSRPSGYSPGELDERAFGHYDLLPFTPEQARAFASRWFGEGAEKFLEEFARVRAGALGGTPLLLTIAAKVYGERGALPGRRSALYDQFVDIWLEEAKGRGLSAELGERVSRVAKFGLARLALAMTERPGLTLRDLEQEAAAYLRDALRLSDDEAEAEGPRFVEVMARRSGVFTRRGEACDFIHPTFREYLAAWALVQACRKDGGYDLKRAWERAVSRWGEERWQEVALFALSFLSDAGQDVTPLVRRIWRKGEEGLRFAGTVLAEGVPVERGLSDAIIDALLTRARAAIFESWPISILGELRGYPRAGDGLLVLARDERVNGWVRVRAAEALGELGRAEEAAPILLALTRDEQVDGLVRLEAASALGRLGRAEDLLALARDERVGVDVRERAAEALGKLGRAEDLLALARDERVDGQVRLRAAGALGRLGRAEEAAQAWLALARDKRVSGQVRERAAKALGELGRAEEAAQAWLALARDERVDAWMRQRAAEALGELGRAEEAAPILLALAHDERVDGWMREHAAEALGELGRAEEAAPILLALAHDEQMDDWTREYAAEALGRLGRAEEAAPILLALARDEWVGVDVRERAAEALGELERAEDLLALARDEWVGVDVRERAAEALGRLGRAEEAAPILLALARDEWVGVDVRERAAGALGELGRAEEAAQAWRALARDERVYGWMRERAAETLGRLGRAEEAAQAWLGLARDEKVDGQVRVHAAEALGRLRRAAEAAQAWLALARDERVYGWMRERAAETLSRLGRAEEAAQAWLALARDKKLDWWTRVDAAEALGKWADARVLPELERIARRDKSEAVRRAAQQAVERIRRRGGAG